MNKAVLILMSGLCVAALKPLAAQQAVGVAPTAGVSTTPPPVSSSSTAQSGPRLQPELRRFEASVSDSSTAARVSPVNYSGGGATITLSTLALVLVVVIIVLLVAK
ncbi:MAG TPA: hypothetical protein VNH84_13850 [Candidatus Saccharimonadales bacterium]|nr:hypothetical protein [Candidatus Saccharimonadales bacterium]HXJ30521.1 hypothetical protein [Gemmatimonadales bacterium]